MSADENATLRIQNPVNSEYAVIVRRKGFRSSMALVIAAGETAYLPMVEVMEAEATILEIATQPAAQSAD